MDLVLILNAFVVQTDCYRIADAIAALAAIDWRDWRMMADLRCEIVTLIDADIRS